MKSASGGARQAVFLDRDGVLIRTHVRDGKPYAVTDAQDVAIIDGVKNACESLAHAGFLLVMVTNQPDVARGLTPRRFVEEVNARLVAALHLDSVRVCYHDDRDNCDCRKPKPGLIIGATEDFSIELRRSVMVGDRWRDIEAGRRAGCLTVLVGDGYDEAMPHPPDHVAASLADAVPWIRTSLATAEGC